MSFILSNGLLSKQKQHNFVLDEPRGVIFLVIIHRRLQATHRMLQWCRDSCAKSRLTNDHVTTFNLNLIMGGGGTSYTGGGFPRTKHSTCEALSFETVLVSPSTKVVSTLRVGDTLQLRLNTVKEIETVDAYTKRGDRAGSLTGSRVRELIACMKKHYEFIAEVVKLNGGECKVCVKHA